MLIAIEGNIGAGKSTLLRNLHARYPQVIVCEENTKEWNSYMVDETPILEAFYKNKEEHAFTLQMAILLTRIRTLMDSQQEESLIFIERSMFADAKIFCKMLNEMDTSIISDAQMKIVTDWVDVFSEFCKIDMYIYLNVSENLCMQRIKSRERPGEEEITGEYITQLKEKHDEWFNTDFRKPILHIHNNEDEDIDMIFQFIEHQFPNEFERFTRRIANPRTSFPSIAPSCRK